MSYDEISQLRLVRPPGDPCRPLREPRSGEGPKGKSVPRGGSPWRAAAAAKAPTAALPPQSLSWGWPAGLVQIPPLLGEWGRLPAGLWGARGLWPPTRKRGHGRGQQELGFKLLSGLSVDAGGGLITCFLYITFHPQAGVGGQHSEVGEIIPARFGLSVGRTYCSPYHPSFLVGKDKVGSVSPPKSQ